MYLRTSLLALVTVGGAAAALVPQDPAEAAERSWVSVTGTVAATVPEAFTMDYGEGLITVEMDDWDWYDEADNINPGERVTVYGRIDDGLYEARTIEADSVYVADRNTFFYANDVDEEGDYFVYPHFVRGYAVDVPEGTWMTVSGKVVGTDGREFTVDTGFNEVKVDTDEMVYNPMDDVGFQKIEKGHRVTVTGTLDVDFFEQDEIKAEEIVTLSRDKTKKRSGKPKTRKKSEG